jgi:hypothetical protein
MLCLVYALMAGPTVVDWVDQKVTHYTNEVMS